MAFHEFVPKRVQALGASHLSCAWERVGVRGLPAASYGTESSTHPSPNGEEPTELCLRCWPTLRPRARSRESVGRKPARAKIHYQAGAEGDADA